MWIFRVIPFIKLQNDTLCGLFCKKKKEKKEEKSGQFLFK